MNGSPKRPAQPFSFDDDLQQEWRWSERYPRQPEILAYLDHVADRFDLRRDIRLGTRVTAASFDDGWTVRTERGDELSARFLIGAVGCLSSANVPELPGLDAFSGDRYHTGRWPHEEVDFTGKRVGVIGTGSTGIQAIPVIAEQAAHLTVFQRTPNFSVPARNAPLDERFQAAVRAEYAEIRALQRETSNGHPFRISSRNAVDTPPDQRREVYEAAWRRGGLRFRAAFNDLLSSEDANDTAAEFIREKIREIVRDPEVAERLLPHDHPFAAKRPPIDTGYFETYNRDDVTLVDVRETPIVEVTRRGLRTTEVEHPLDALVFATGFDAMTGPMLGIDVRGTNGTLAEKWRDGPRSYLGLQVAGFPNLFIITGPGSPSVLTNMPTSIEQHVDWIARCLGDLRDDGFERIEATEEAERAWGEEVQAAANRTLLPQAKSSWYLGANVPGKPRVFMPYAGGLAHYAALCDEAAAHDYAGFHRS
ncbi:flavin-containing monooxygenase [Saccharopolyspora aridisoli]|uniref:flavin-containing monooxygenase n=1 Tax=Saccharopolyspora aridisoli TaxID=2530385 RepID=UPI001F1F4EE9|nr:NAD(P)/FAD-dependent oxidoreductase [Saccharopolyspora aridisoli]